LEIELEMQGTSFIREKPLDIHYKGRKLKKEYFPDFICFDKIIVELKTVDEITSKHISQVLNYLKATGFRLGILVNFGEKSLTWKRIVK
jgi:GxxExxY protein